MFPFFKHFFIMYLLILSYIYTASPQSSGKNEVTKSDIEQQIQGEMAPLLDKLKKVLNTVDKDVRLKQEGILEGELNALVKRVIIAETKNEKLLKNEGVLENEKKKYEKVLRIISARSKLEGFVDKLYPLRKDTKTNETIYGKPNMGYCDALNELLTSKSERFAQDPFICMVRQRLIDRNIEVRDFMKFARWLYKQFSDSACHKMAQFSPQLPKYNDVEEIEEMFKAVQIDQDIPAIICMQIVLQPLDLPPRNATVAPPSSSTKNSMLLLPP